jgi:hypothetical protein
MRLIQKHVSHVALVHESETRTSRLLTPREMCDPSQRQGKGAELPLTLAQGRLTHTCLLVQGVADKAPASTAAMGGGVEVVRA